MIHGITPVPPVMHKDTANSEVSQGIHGRPSSFWMFLSWLNSKVGEKSIQSLFLDYCHRSNLATSVLFVNKSMLDDQLRNATKKNYIPWNKQFAPEKWMKMVIGRLFPFRSRHVFRFQGGYLRLRLVSFNDLDHHIFMHLKTDLGARKSSDFSILNVFLLVGGASPPLSYKFHINSSLDPCVFFSDPILNPCWIPPGYCDFDPLKTATGSVPGSKLPGISGRKKESRGSVKRDDVMTIHDNSGFMYGIFIYFYHKNQPNVGEYNIKNI